jgi:hypothetical protein
MGLRISKKGRDRSRGAVHDRRGRVQVTWVTQDLLRYLRCEKGEGGIDRVNNAMFRQSIWSLLRHANRHEETERMLMHDDMAVNHEVGLVHVIIRLPHVVDEVRERFLGVVPV